MKTELVKQIESVLEQTGRPLNLKEAAEYLNLSKTCLYHLTSARKIPFYKPNNKKIYFLKEDLRAWLLQRKISSNSELDSKAERGE